MITTILAILCGSFGATAEAPVLHSGEIGVEGFRCVVGDNEKWGEGHGAGYNGVFLMEMPGMAATPFVPAYAGLNLEHYFDLGSRSEDNSIFFEPRRAPMTFALLNAYAAELHQPTSPHYGVESWTRFDVNAPGRLDMRFRCVPHKAGLEGGVLGVFWASYINAPLDKSMHFLAAGSTLDAPVWEQYATQQHNRDSTLISENDTRDLKFESEHGTLFDNLSPLRYSVPFFYGNQVDHVLIYIFEPSALIRFSQSPSGGGPTAAKDGHNPAWDFQYLIPGYETEKEYSFRMCLVCKPWKDRADIIAEVRTRLKEMEKGNR